MTTTELKKFYNAYIEASKVCDAADEAWDADLENEELEAEFDRTYALQNKALEQLTKAISEFTKGQITEKTARVMVMKFEGNLQNLFDRIA